MKFKTAPIFLAFLVLGCLAPALAATEPALPTWAIGPFTRVQDGHPVISPNTNSVFDCPLSKAPVHWEKAWVYNPAAVVKDGKIIVLYRAQQGPGNSCSRIGYAESEDGIHFKTDPTPVLFPAEDAQKEWEWSGSDRHGGCEDPRLAESPDGFYVMTYTQYSGRNYRLGLATSKDLKTWTKQGAAFAGTKYENKSFKSAAIVHEVKDGRLVAARINGKYWMYFNISGGLLATSDDLIHWTPVENGKGGLLSPMPGRKGFFDSALDEIGPQALLTTKGIVVFYNGMNSTKDDSRDPSIARGIYSGGQALFDRNDPTHLIARLDKSYIKPEFPWEKTGLYKDGTTFTEGLVLFKDQWFVYYGCADSFVGAAISPAKTELSLIIASVPILLSATGGAMQVSINPDNGVIISMTYAVDGGEPVKVAFRDDTLAGPAFAGVALQRTKDGEATFGGMKDGVEYTLKYEVKGDALSITSGMKNTGSTEFAPLNAGLVLGLNTEMPGYPEWNDRFFPTLLRCEKTHFWGYLMTPKGKILTIGSGGPIASYAMNYNVDRNQGGHLIYTCTLDLLHALPLPPRHPQNLVSLKPGEKRNWTIYLQPAGSLDDVKPILAASLSAPMIDADRYTVAAGESSLLTIRSSQPVVVKVTGPDGGVMSPLVELKSKTTGQVKFTPASGPGLYTVTVAGSNGHQSEACVSVRHPWSWYMNQARKEAIRHKQYASSHLEQWLGLQTGVLARWRLPEATLDAQMDQRLMEILRAQWDLDKKVPTNIPHGSRKFPNTAQMAGLLAYRYFADQDTNWLDLASGFADYAVSRQSADGNYVNYTTVFYPVKSVLTVAAAEKQAMSKDGRFKAAFNRHYDSAKKAADFLVRSQDNLITEGELTFEDGMISCSGMQMGLFALLQKDAASRERYAEAARKMLVSHRCLEQLLIPDSRMNGATLRFWEAQYDTLIGKTRNMMNSPHGWSAWLIPGLWYQYLLTGEEAWLQKTMNAMGSCAQLVDSKTGELRWAFVPDPYRDVTMLEPNPENPMRGKRVERIIGEQYVPMIAAFHYPDHEPISGNSPAVGWTCCNDVHEVFIALEEVALTSAYVLQRADGQLVTWNCSASKETDGTIAVTPAEKLVSRVHINLTRPETVEIRMPGNPTVRSKCGPGMQWLGPGGVPELLR